MTAGGRNLTSNAKNNILMEIYRHKPDYQAWLKVHDFDPVANTVNPVYPSLRLSG
jgi:hypothetical protein